MSPVSGFRSAAANARTVEQWQAFPIDMQLDKMIQRKSANIDTVLKGDGDGADSGQSNIARELMQALLSPECAHEESKLQDEQPEEPTIEPIDVDQLEEAARLLELADVDVEQSSSQPELYPFTQPGVVKCPNTTTWVYTPGGCHRHAVEFGGQASSAAALGPTSEDVAAVVQDTDACIDLTASDQQLSDRQLGNASTAELAQLLDDAAARLNESQGSPCGLERLEDPELDLIASCQSSPEDSDRTQDYRSLVLAAQPTDAADALADQLSRAVRPRQECLR